VPPIATLTIQKIRATTANMVADCNARAMSVITMNSKGHG